MEAKGKPQEPQAGPLSTTIAGEARRGWLIARASVTQIPPPLGSAALSIAWADSLWLWSTRQGHRPPQPHA